MLWTDNPVSTLFWGFSNFPCGGRIDGHCGGPTIHCHREWLAGSFCPRRPEKLQGCSGPPAPRNERFRPAPRVPGAVDGIGPREFIFRPDGCGSDSEGPASQPNQRAVGLAPPPETVYLFRILENLEMVTQGQARETSQQLLSPVSPALESAKPLGQVLTPPAIARLMAAMFDPPPSQRIRVLDPGSGRGILTEAFVNRLIDRREVKTIHVDAYELDDELAAENKATLEDLRDDSEKRGVQLTFKVNASDFVKSAWVSSDKEPPATYDLIITNPPYSKIRKDSDLAKLAREVVHGQPNIYGLFLVLGCRLLKPDGQIVAIAPRSWMSGTYFHRVRTDILARVNIRQVRAFHVRDEAFNSDGVLQETTIFHAVSPATEERPDVHIAISSGVEDDEPTTFSVPWQTLAPPKSPVIRLPETLQQLAALRTLDRYPLRLNDLGLSVSTGPVVPFRATSFLERKKSRHADVPLVWLSHVCKGRLNWSPEEDSRQPPFIHACVESEKLLLPWETMVLVRRFSAKEDAHRVIACCLPSSKGLIGLENHLNVIRGFKGNGRDRLALAITNYLNSDLVDQYIRAMSGTTQVNALELRQLPIPDETTLLNRWSLAR